jgi:hypothetical protein
MSSLWMAAMMAALGLAFAGVTEAEIFVYPKPGQGQAEFQDDQFECHDWAKQETGFDPAKPQTVAAAIGAQNRQAAEAARQAESQQQANFDRYERAYAACLGGRGYTVK